jgi:hypothetical protein
MSAMVQLNFGDFGRRVAHRGGSSMEERLGEVGLVERGSDKRPRRSVAHRRATWSRWCAQGGDVEGGR